jgi:hypothetical protein
VAPAVDEVVGVRVLAAGTLEETPPLLGDALGGVIEALATLDAALLVVLRAARVLPEATWDALSVRDRAP